MFNFIYFFLHIDRYLASAVQHYPVWIYGLLFLVIFIETGVIVFPFLPGDSLLFAVGTLAASGALNLWNAFFLLAIAAILGDSVNYWVGHHFRHRVLHYFVQKNFFLNVRHLRATEEFYHHHGNKTIILARFVPIIRTLAPFVAGVGQMRYLTFFVYNVLGGIAWTGLFIFGGYLFGNLPIVRDHLSLVIIGIIILSIVPFIIEGIKRLVHRK